VRRRGALAAPAAVLAAGLAGLAGLAGCGASAHPAAPAAAPASHAASTSAAGSRASTARSPTSLASSASSASSASAAAVAPRPARARPPYAIRTDTVTFVDAGRTVVIPGQGRVPRRLVTILRYPADRTAGPFPLVIFGHGFAVTPRIYARLLIAWARAGYVVAAPVFPLENQDAPGGPDERDLINQPGDMSFLMTALTGSQSPVRRLVDPDEIAVAGQSDGGETALAVSYDRAFRDPRVKATVVLSGAQIPGVNQLVFPSGGPPLLATQGTDDPINPPSLTNAFFALAHPPKFLLELDGASHLPPYTDGQPDLGIVERTTIAFLNRYLRDHRDGLAQMARAGNRPGVSQLIADP
jgi:dienelactone hydrolase